MKKTKFIFLVLIVILFNSCIGLKIDIQMNRDGSGKLLMEYRISRTFENIGNFEGNEKWPVIPIGRADWERTIDRIDGAKLSSFLTSQRGPDSITSITIDYDNPQALLAILDPNKEKAQINLDNRSGQFSYIINEERSQNPYNFNDLDLNENLMDLARTMFTDYKFSISFTAPQAPTLLITDGNGSEITKPTAAEVAVSGRRASMTIGIIDAVELSDGLGIQISW